jgi:hypothetical protein
MTTYRDVCGTLRGMIAHQSAGEDPCGWCRQAETAARLAAEAVTWRPSPADPLIEPVSREQAAINAASLVAELDAFEAEHPGAWNGRYRHPAPVSPGVAERDRDVLEKTTRERAA